MSDGEGREAPGIDQHQLIQMAVEEHKRGFGDPSSSSSDKSSSFATSDVTSNTHHFSSENEDSDALSSDSSDPEPDIDQTIRVYDARFKIPAQSNIG